MDGASLNQYEEQLYSMFKSFDVNNEEALDESAVNALCDALQLEERGAALVDTLFDSRAGRVSFAAFRGGLLAVLGDAEPARRPPDPDPEPSPNPDSDPDPVLRPLTAEELSPADEEAAPGLLFGSKRYGRRSRPVQPASTSRAASASRADPRPAAATAAGARRARRSTSALEPRAPAAPALAHDERIDGEAALALCRDLRMDGIDRDVVDRVFEDSPTGDTTVGEFFERLESTLARDLRGVAERGPRPDGDETLDAERLLEEWESAGVARPRRLLAELGFPGAAGGAIDGERLERALDSELSVAPPDATSAAALCVARLRAGAARARALAVEAERDKLREAVAAADSRAALLAREVDERQARVERELRDGVRRAEARHAEEARRARAAADAELERSDAERARLASEAARRGEAEARARAVAEESRARAAGLEERLAEAERALEASRGERARLAERLAGAEDRARDAEAAAEEARVRAESAAREARRLQDRADELAAALEARAASAGGPERAAPPPPPPDGSLSAELGDLLAPREPESASEAVAAGAAAAAGAEDADGERERERERLQELVKELEGALEAMRAEYEACEEYWAGKQREERRAHEAELRAADQRLADLLARVAAFERRLPPRATLPPVAEAPLLEAQALALEEELAATRREAEGRVQRLAEQLSRAHRRLAALQRRRPPPAAVPAPAPAPAPCARCRRAEAAAARAALAEAAVRRLQARLVAADVLVKELYVENCQLAR